MGLALFYHRMTLDPRTLIRPFYLGQALAVAAWWALLVTVPGSRQPFLVDGIGWPVFRAFLWPDALLLVGGSLVAAWRPVAGLRLLLLGAVAYPTLLCVAWSVASDSGHAAAVAMALMLVGNASVCAELQLFRTARPASPATHIACTLSQLVPFWGLFLVVLPWHTARLDPLRVAVGPLAQGLAAGAFALAGALGIASAVVMAGKGLGTPLPVAAPALLVVSGPYRWLRNPMAAAGVLQVMAVAVMLGSPVVAVYAVMGALIWQLVARPSEEADLATRFGADYARYRARVPLWVPRVPVSA